MSVIAQSAAAAPAVDWRLAPVHARWWAVEDSGEAFWYCAPRLAPMTGFWFCDQVPAPDFGYRGDWRLSLVERPPNSVDDRSAQENEPAAP